MLEARFQSFLLQQTRVRFLVKAVRFEGERDSQIYSQRAKNILLGLGCRSWSTLFKIQCSISFLNCYLATFEKLRFLSKNFSMLLWATFGKIGLVFIPTFGSHVVCSVDVLRTLELSVTHIHVRQELTETLIFFCNFFAETWMKL